MTHDLRTMLRDDLLADEPTFLMSSAPSTTAGRRVVRRRRALGAVVGGAAAVLAVLAGSLLLPGNPTDHPVVTPPAAKAVLDGFDRRTFPAIFDGEVRAQLGTQLPASATARIAPTLDGWTVLPEKDYGYTDAWSSWYTVSSVDALRVMIRQDQSSNEGSARRYCRAGLADATFVRCTVDAGVESGVAIDEVMVSRRDASGGLSRDQPSATGDRWFTRAVVHRRDYGFQVVVAEDVRADTLAQADRRWSIDVEGLTRVATSPKLVYELPPASMRHCHNPSFTISGDGTGAMRCITS